MMDEHQPPVTGLPEALRQWIGRESGPVRAPGPVEWSDVRRYINATGDRNPLWGAGASAGDPHRRGALAPPVMILDVLRPGSGQDEPDERGERGFPSLGGLAATIPVPGERARVNASTEIEWARPLRIGDWVAVRFKIVDIALKDGQAGPSVAITEERAYTDQRGEPIATVRQTTVRLLDRTVEGQR
jgi:acyl dehydratase